MSKGGKRTGTIIAAHGRHYLAEADGQRLQCVTRGKKTNVAVGDIVDLTLTSPDQAVIDKIQERKTLLYRSDQYKSKLLAANVDQLFIVVATEPGFSDDLVSRALVAAEAAGIHVRLLLNKVDVADALPRARERLQVYAAMGYEVLEVSATGQPEQTGATLAPLLQGHSSILIGQSGMGKSSLINLLVPDADIATREISEALDTGKHTTTFTRLYHVGPDSSVIDSGVPRLPALPWRLPLLQLPPPERTAMRGAGGGQRRQDREDAAHALRPAAARIVADTLLTGRRCSICSPTTMP
jgi:ribosome biogenesis GTPase